MSDKQERERNEQAKQQQAEIRNEAIARQVIESLGHPIDLWDVRARHLWENRYRVNVFVGTDASSLKIAHSYFVETDADGNIVESIPKIIQLKHSPAMEKVGSP